MTGSGDLVLEARDLVKHYDVGSGLGRRQARVRAVDGVSLRLHAGEIVGLVGESGSGKSTLGKVLMRLLSPTSGQVFFDGADVTAASRRELRRVHRDVRMVFQDPYSSLDPRMTVGQIVSEPLRLHHIATGDALDDRVRLLFRQCGLDPDWRDRYPHQLSGGQRQRVGLARALSTDPRVLVADEPVSALDVSVQASILNLLLDLQSEMGFACLFISHDLSVVEFVSNRIAVMYLGKLVEVAPTRELFEGPRHPYTQFLLSASLPPDRRARRRRLVAPGDAASPLHPPPGCPFHPRCPVAVMGCRTLVPELTDPTGEGHLAACHLVDDSGRPPSLTR